MSALPPPPPPPPWAARPPVPPAPDPWSAPHLWGRGPAWPPEPPRPRWLAPLGTAITVVLIAGLLAVAARSLEGGLDHPDEWDPRVAGLAEFVEDERGLQFDHPVYVDFLTAAEYTEATTGGDVISEEDERRELDEYAGQLRALGVASGELDLYEAFNAVIDSGTLAFYDPAEERVRVRGTDMTVGLEVTIVHELTHALQDQRFELDRLGDPTIDSSASAAFRALGEGDALRVENAYVDESLTEAEQREYHEEFARELADSEAATTDVPPFLEATFGAPYALGQPFVTMLFNQDGNDGVDDAFEEPPYTEEHLLDPASFLAGEGATEVDVDLPARARTIEEGPFGATAWYLVLAERIDPKVAFEAALGWGGDAYTMYRRDGDVCVQAVFEGATRDDDEEMTAALTAWVEAMVGDRAELVDVGGHVGFDSCDPGEDIDLELTGRSETSLYLPNLWGFLVADAATALDAEGCRCYARAVLDDLTYEQIADPEAAFYEEAAFQQLLERSFSGCS
jgi:hypothetical protein